jgi:DNA/RNA-binding domain of Phe-tRNA-synthetase-like protein
MRYAGDEPDVRTGRSALDGVTLLWTVADAAPGRSPKELRERLRAAADRMTGAQAVALRHRDVVHAYRVFFRHIGIDPDERPTPVEAIARRRMRHGTLLSRGLVEDALTVATLETAVPLCALDADRLHGAPRIEATAPPAIADADGPVAVLFEAAGARAALSAATRRIALAAVGVPGVPRLSVEEAVWIAWDTLA